jgi:S-adenosylhomocysteine hydrolase
VPSAVDRRIAERKFDALGVEIGAFTPDQRVSLDSYGRD